MVSTIELFMYRKRLPAGYSYCSGVTPAETSAAVLLNSHCGDDLAPTERGQ